MALLTVQQVSRVGAAPTFAAATGGGDTCPTGNNVWIEVKNTSGTSTTVTLATNAGAAPFPGVPFAAETFVVPITTGDMIYGPILPQLFNDATDGLLHITYSQVSGITIAVFQMAAV
jgi:hypothetical protein